VELIEDPLSGKCTPLSSLDTVEQSLDSYFVRASLKKENKNRVGYEKNLFYGPIFGSIGICNDGDWSVCR
jgi:hypothetical protein